MQSFHQIRKGCGHIVALLCMVALLQGCSATRKLPPHEKLYTGASVKIEDKTIKTKHQKELRNELEGLLRPFPNKSFLGFRYKLFFYNMIDTVRKEKSIGNFIKNKLGEPPVLFSDVSTDANTSILCNRLENRGYFKTRCSADIKEKDKKVKVLYTVVPGYQYTIDSVIFVLDTTTVLGAEINNTVEETFLEKDDPYDLDVIKAERERIDLRLKEKGFYYFSPDDLLVLVDSTEGEHKVDLYVNVKPTTPIKARQQYRIANTFIFPDYSIAEESIDKSNAVKHGDFYMVDPEQKWKPVTFQNFIHFKPGDLYNRTDHNLALNNMVSLGAFKFVKNKFEEVGDSSKLDVHYLLTPYPKKSIRAEITGKKTDADFTGTELTVNWRNRNTFRGSELLTISAYTGADIQSGDNSIQSNRSYFKIGTKATLSAPRFITPFKVTSYGPTVPSSRASLGYDLLQRKNAYTLHSVRSIGGYSWRESFRKSHELNILDVNYVHAERVTDEYKQLAETDRTLRKAIEDQFTIGSTYRFVFTNTALTQKINTIYYSSGIDLSGNILGLATGANIKEGNVKRLFGTPFSQYIKLENDLRYYWKISERAKLANRIFFGLGYAYGNSISLPFVKQFFIGGSSSVRAFRARVAGPGSYNAADDPNATAGFTADQSGDIKLEMSTEYRRTIAGILEGAVFVDAGNIWLVNDELDPAARKPGSLFTSRFMNDLLVGTGAGLRVNLSFVIIRFDLAFPLRKPWLPEGERWRFDDIRFGDPDWRKENLVFHVAIGYPF
jgi:outer membrane protein insertion porin family